MVQILKLTHGYKFLLFYGNYKRKDQKDFMTSQNNVTKNVDGGKVLSIQEVYSVRGGSDEMKKWRGRGTRDLKLREPNPTTECIEQYILVPTV